MRTRRLLVLAVALLVGITASAAQETEYNQGVQAYRTRDYAAARQHWAQAVEQGESLALNNLGFLLYEGLGGDADPARAVELWKRAALRGNDESQWHLAQAFEVGKGASRSLVDAYAWYRCAAASLPQEAEDDEDRRIARDARASVLRLLGTLPVAQLSTAEQLARDYIAKYSAKPGA
jgi:TPR repeat protein